MPDLIDNILAAATLVRGDRSLPTDEAKVSRVGSLIVQGGAGQPAWTEQRYEAQAKEGYVLNVVANRCVKLITSGIASLQWMALGQRGRTDPNHPLKLLMDRPNPLMGGSLFWEYAVAYWMIAGNSYIEEVSPNGGPPRELYALRPDRITILQGNNGWPKAYRYETAQGKRDYPVDGQGRSSILHLREFNPLSDWYGLSPMQVAGRAIDQHNAAGAHNHNLLHQGARPSGLLVFKQELSREQVQRAEDVVGSDWSGVQNTGRIKVLGGEWQFISTAMNLKDLEFGATTQQKAREICAAWGIPHHLVVPGESTYNNMENAYLELWEHAILPRADALLGELNNWLAPRFGRVRLAYDRDQITALEPMRTKHRESVRAEWDSGLVTLDEAREALQYEPLGPGRGGDQTKPSVGAGLAQAEASPKPASNVVPLRRSVEAKALDDEIANGLPDDELTREGLPILREVIRHFGRRVMDRIDPGIAFDIFDPAVLGFLEQWGATRIKELVGTTTRQALASALAEGRRAGEPTRDLMRRVRDVFDLASESRARMIAETEVTLAAGYATQCGMVQAGVELKQWLSTGDSRVRETHRAMNGQIRDVHEPFVSPSGARGMGPGMFSQASETVNCRCGSIPLVRGVDVPEDFEPGKAAALADEWKLYDAARVAFDDEMEAAMRRGFEEQARWVLRRMALDL